MAHFLRGILFKEKSWNLDEKYVVDQRAYRPIRPVEEVRKSHEFHTAHPRAHVPEPQPLQNSQSRTRSASVLSSLSFYSPSASTSSVDLTSLPISQEVRSPSRSSVLELPENLARSFLSKGSRALKRQGSKFSLSSTISPDNDTKSMANYPNSAGGGQGQQWRPRRSASIRRESFRQWHFRPLC